MSNLLHLLQDGPLGQAMRGSHILVGAGVQIVHVLGFVLLLTAVLLLSLRLLGLGLRQQSVAEVARLARPLLWGGLAAAVLSGVAMFASNAVVYAHNPALQLKLALLVGAVLLQLGLVRLLLARPRGRLLDGAGALASLLLWFGTGLAGRAIGFL